MERGTNFPKFCENLYMEPNFLIFNSSLEWDSITGNQLKQDIQKILAAPMRNFIFSDSEDQGPFHGLISDRSIFKVSELMATLTFLESTGSQICTQFLGGSWNYIMH